MQSPGRRLRISRDYFLAIVSLLLGWLCFSPVETVCAEVWGDANLSIYPVKSQVAAPNGLIYNPLAHIGIDLNIGNENIYLFGQSDFMLEKPTPGVTTNSNQGSFDFTKREADFVIGLAGRPFPFKNLEFRLWSFALNNLNRGIDNNKPNGFKDGSAIETRYYFNGAKIWGYAKGGFYFAKQLVEPNGEYYKPGPFVGANLNYDLLAVPKEMYAFADMTLINGFGRFEGGMAFRPFKSLPDTELRVAANRYMDLNEERAASDTGAFIGIRHYFATGKAGNSQPDYVDAMDEPVSEKSAAYETATKPIAADMPSTKPAASMPSIETAAIAPSTDVRATNVWFDARMMRVSLNDGREIGVPLKWFPKLRDAHYWQRKGWSLSSNGTTIRWGGLDMDISVARLLHG